MQYLTLQAHGVGQVGGGRDVVHGDEGGGTAERPVSILPVQHMPQQRDPGAETPKPDVGLVVGDDHGVGI